MTKQEHANAAVSAINKLYNAIPDPSAIDLTMRRIATTAVEALIDVQEDSEDGFDWETATAKDVQEAVEKGIIDRDDAIEVESGGKARKNLLKWLEGQS